MMKAMSRYGSVKMQRIKEEKKKENRKIRKDGRGQGAPFQEVWFGFSHIITHLWLFQV